MTSPTSRSSLWVALLLLAAPVVVFTACSSPPTGVTQTSPDTYVVTVRDRSGVIVNEPQKLKTMAVSQAMDFAAEKGKVAVSGRLNEQTYGVFGDWTTVEYHFTLVDKNDPRAKRTTFDYNDRDQVEKQAALDQRENKTKPPELDKNSDVYAELLKLDDLRKKGILTQAEFESEKKKLLARPK